jgi:hypothetical protein
MRLRHTLCALAATILLSVPARAQEETALPVVVVSPNAKPPLEPQSLPPIPARASTAIIVPEFLGDQTPMMSIRSLPSGQIQGAGVLYVPSVRYLKISDNDSPRPQTRSYFSFNYFYNLGDRVNERAGAGIQHTRIHREIWGLEWAAADGSSSFALRLPLTTYNAANTVVGLDGTSTDLGDLAVIFKYLLWQNGEGSLLSSGLAITTPTAGGSFAGSNSLKVFHNTGLQPFVGWIWCGGNVYFQGFTAVDAPTDLNDVVMMSNSVAAGYFLYQNRNGNSLSAVVPTVEIHVNTPLNHRGIGNFTDPAGTPDMVNLTSGFHFEYQDRSSMGVAFVVPLTGPRLFDFEIVAQFRWRY